MINRIYRYRDIEMLLGSRIAAENFLRNLSELSRVLMTWNEEKAYNLINKIDEGIQILGVDSKKELHQATQKLNLIQEPALDDLNFIKKVIPVLFKKESSYIMDLLGYTKFHKEARRGDQEALIHLLIAFEENINGELQERITEKGINPEIIERIISYRDELWSANVSQETLKDSTKEITEESVHFFNQIYQEIIDICKIAAAFYADRPIKKSQFTFSRIVKNMNAGRSLSQEDEQDSETE